MTCALIGTFSGHAMVLWYGSWSGDEYVERVFGYAFLVGYCFYSWARSGELVKGLHPVLGIVAKGLVFAYPAVCAVSVLCEVAIVVIFEVYAGTGQEASLEVMQAFYVLNRIIVPIGFIYMDVGLQEKVGYLWFTGLLLLELIYLVLFSMKVRLHYDAQRKEELGDKSQWNRGAVAKMSDSMFGESNSTKDEIESKSNAAQSQVFRSMSWMARTRI